MMIVGGHVRIVKKLLHDNPRGLQAAEAIETAAKRGETLTRQLLAFSRRQPLNPVVAELGQRIDALRALLANSLGSSIQLKTLVASDTWPVEIDVGELELALVNVAVNSRDAMPDGGYFDFNRERTAIARRGLWRFDW
jgi:signal transduction histidine kinase